MDVPFLKDVPNWSVVRLPTGMLVVACPHKKGRRRLVMDHARLMEMVEGNVVVDLLADPGDCALAKLDQLYAEYREHHADVRISDEPYESI